MLMYEVNVKSDYQKSLLIKNSVVNNIFCELSVNQLFKKKKTIILFPNIKNLLNATKYSKRI